MSSEDSPKQNESELEAAIAEYLAAEEQGSPPDRQGFLDDHPACAEELREFLADHERLRQAAGQRNRVGEPAAGPPSAARLHDMTTEFASSWQSSPSASSYGLPRVREGTTSVAFGEYELIEEIARGGMGVVYRANQPRLRRTVAIKMILSGGLANESEVRRFQAEAGAAARLEHPGIVPIHEIGHHEGLHYYTMSFVEGRSLARILDQGPLPPMQAAQLVRKIAESIAYAHEHQIIHRDLKPANILVTSLGDPRVTDFGLAKCLDRGEMLTATGQVLGTLSYMAPEQAMGKEQSISAQTDIYGLGAILYATLTGRAPHQGASQVDLLLRVMESEPPHPRALNPLIPRELERICLRCLEKSPRRRYPTANDLARDLDLFLRGEQPLGVPIELMESVRRLPRRMPALCAHLGAIASVETVRQGRWLVAGPELWTEQWNYHWQFTGIFLLWAAVCMLFHFLLQKPAIMEATRYLWAGADALFVTWILLLAQGPVSLLYPAYALLIVAAGSLFRVRLIIWMTTLAILSFLLVIRLRPDEGHPPHHLLVCIGMLVVIGVIMGYHVRRLRTLYGYFEQGQRW